MVPVTLNLFCGRFSLLPADPRDFSAQRTALEEVVHEIGNVMLDDHAHRATRLEALQYVCLEPSAAPQLIEASSGKDSEVEYRAMGCRIDQGDVGLLERLADSFAAANPPPAAVLLAPAIAGIYSHGKFGVQKPGPITALAKMAHARLPALRLAALRALGQCESLLTVPALRPILLHSPDPEDRFMAAYALWQTVGGIWPAPTEADFRADPSGITKILLDRAACMEKHEVCGPG
ncbi:MAG: hypothetical protein EPN33_04055 [Acidobacteria bacterium]|nr:MAG: hypothetical protein EPN33_04055 [Acidobacteriota bacterium]